MSTIRMSLRAGVAAAALILAADLVPATAQTFRDLTPEQSQAAEPVKVQPSTLQVVAMLDRVDATYAVDETVRLAIKTNEDAYVTVFNIGASGKVTQLFPNAYQSDNKVNAGQTIEIPGAASGAQLKISAPVGAELIKIVATSKPVKVVPEARLSGGDGLFAAVEGGSKGLTRDLEVVAATAAADVKVAIADQVIKTIATRPAATGKPGVVTIPMAAVVTAVPVTVPVPASDFPLLLAADRATYRVGDKITLAVTALQACRLRLVALDGAGKARRLVPGALAGSGDIAALQTLLVSGGPSPFTISAGVVGPLTITALCATDVQAAAAAAEEMTAEDKAAFERDVQVATTQPGKKTGYAQISVTVVR